MATQPAPGPTLPRKWWDDREELLAFVKAVNEAGGFESARDGSRQAVRYCIDVFENPWAHDLDHSIWVESGRPACSLDTGWDRFRAVL